MKVSVGVNPTLLMSLKIRLETMDLPRVTNGTGCMITKLSAYSIEAKISHGIHAHHEIINLQIPRNSTLPLEFRRVQFPVSLCFTITIKKSQEQIFKVVGVDMNDESFTHGMLYVALSRVCSPESRLPVTVS